MTEDKQLEHMRHTLAHLLAAAVMKHYPDAKPTLGPAIEGGFYYDFDFGDEKIAEDDLKAIEKTMKKLLPSWTEFEGKEVSPDEARDYFKENEYKKELIDELEKKGETITFYTSGGFTDLCRGGHVDNPAKDIDPKGFTLDRIAGAYWRGDENNSMLTRIYGLAFESEGQLNEYTEKREEALKRDHKKLGKELGLFTFSDLVGQGLPLFTPKGTILRRELENFIEALNREYGYERVWIPHLAKPDLYKTSGHWDKFSDDLFHVQGATGEFVVKPMNCPHHTQIYASEARSYRDLPVRLHETTTVYRDEQSGELSGLTRVRSITQDDGHVFLRPDQIEEEFGRILEMQRKVLNAVGFSDYWISLSLRDPSNKEAYLGDDAVWENAQSTMESILKKQGVEFKTVEGEAAFYGPKMDLQATDSLGREWQLSTIQLDFNMPARFDLEYTDEDGEKKTPIMIHRAFMGSTERFIGMLIEHFAGVFPLWLSPVQVKILPIGEAHHEYAQNVQEELKEVGFRVELDDGGDSLGKKIRNWKVEKVPYALVIGDSEMDSKKVTLESRDKGKEGEFDINALIDRLGNEELLH